MHLGVASLSAADKRVLRRLEPSRSRSAVIDAIRDTQGLESDAIAHDVGGARNPRLRGGRGGEQVVHLQHAASEMVGPVRREVWDVHCPDSRWWVVTNPTNLYDLAGFRVATWCAASASA